MSDQPSKPKPKHFSMLRSYTPADFFTLGNAACGTGAIFACLNHLVESRDERYLWWVFALLPVAFVLDSLDGFVARKTRRQSLIGADLDSLADVISFGVAPAVLGFTLGLRGGWDALVLIYFVACGVSRLARFNVTAESLTDERGKVAYFEGTPIPTSLALVFLLMAAHMTGSTNDTLWFGKIIIGPWTLHPLVLFYALSGSAMISATLRIPKP